MSGGPLRWLLVGEREAPFEALAETLHAPDAELVRARSGGEACALAAAPGVAFAVVDALAPGLEGGGLAELARGPDGGRALPLFVLAAGGADRARAGLAYEAGAVDVLHAPFDLPALRHKARFFFELERQRRRLAEAEGARAREAEAALARAEADLRDARAWHETFVAIVGHDLRSPLNAILVGAQLVARSSDATARRLASHIGASGQRLSDIVEDLCDVARARQGLGFAVDLEPADFGEVVGGVVAELKAAHPSRALVLECGDDLVGHFDKGALARIVANLVGNALRHGAGDAPVDVRVEGSPDACALVIENAGSIAPETVPTLFDPFRAAQGVTTKGYRGLGLGLYISRNLVRAHGGEFKIVSFGGTTRAVVRLPKRPPEPNSAPDQGA
ncbi:MAG TPA: ATP-binding protein [Polyangiaceae bacterium]|nr:ATP-binding protein [Polyangiaceae bacterium]